MDQLKDPQLDASIGEPTLKSACSQKTPPVWGEDGGLCRSVCVDSWGFGCFSLGGVKIFLFLLVEGLSNWGTPKR